MDKSKRRRSSLELERNKRNSTPRNSTQGRSSKTNGARQSFQEMLTSKLLSERIAEGPHLGRDPKFMKCPACKKKITTEVKWKPNMRTHFIALLLCILVLWPCVCLPYCVPSCGDVNHYCPRCGEYIGSS